MGKNKEQDQRFAQANYDPRFDKMSMRQKKIQIDSRFGDIIEQRDKFDKTDDLFQKKKETQDQKLEQEAISEPDEVVSQEEVFSEDEVAPRAEISSSKIALQNFNWQYVRSKQIYLIFESFVKHIYPNVDPSKKLLVVDLYKSDFGEQQMLIEEE